MLKAIAKEILIRAKELDGQRVETIYFGGGTPSLLSADEISKLIDIIQNNFDLDDKAEVTLEANPDDLYLQKLREINATAVNRLSIGVQSFFDEDLKWMNRAHQANEAESAVKRAQDFGLENITIDLIYGYPLLTDEKWVQNISKAVEFHIPHISSYSMTVEPKTALASMIKKGNQKQMDDAQSAAQFEMLMTELKSNGFEHYETQSLFEA
jgi:oxygen-independent coproporphyrinogen-3 oxidase